MFENFKTFSYDFAGRPMVIESGRMTKDLVGLWEGSEAVALTTEEFIKAIRAELEKAM